MKKRKNSHKDVPDYHNTFAEDGIAVVGKNGKFGYVRQNGEEITPFKYDKAMRLYWDVGKVCINGKWGLVNTSGKEITPLKYDNIVIYQSCNCLAAASINNKWGYIDNRTGAEITPFEYDSVEEFSGHRARVEKNGKYGFIDDKSALVIPVIYDDCELYFDEYNPIAAKLNSKYGYIDANGNEMIKFIYEDAASFDCSKLVAVALNGKVGFIDITDKEIIPFIYDTVDNLHEFDSHNIHYYRLFGRYADVKLNGKWGVIDGNNKVVVPFLYDEFLYDEFGVWRSTMRDGKKLSIDTKGNERIMQKNPDARIYEDYYDVTSKVVSKQKNPDARTFKDYLHAVTSSEVVECGRLLLDLSKKEAKTLGINFDNFSTKVPRPSQNIIRIFADCGQRNWEHPPIDAVLYSVEGKCSCVYFDWEEILDMEVRIEDSLILSDAEIVAICIWEACDQRLTTEKNILNSLDRLYEQLKTDDEYM